MVRFASGVVEPMAPLNVAVPAPVLVTVRSLAPSIVLSNTIMPVPVEMLAELYRLTGPLTVRVSPFTTTKLAPSRLTVPLISPGLGAGPSSKLMVPPVK